MKETSKEETERTILTTQSKIWPLAGGPNLGMGKHLRCAASLIKWKKPLPILWTKALELRKPTTTCGLKFEQRKCYIGNCVKARETRRGIRTHRRVYWIRRLVKSTGICQSKQISCYSRIDRTHCLTRCTTYAISWCCMSMWPVIIQERRLKDW